MIIFSIVFAFSCKILALEGGGTHAAYQVGVISQLISSLPPTDLQWDVFTGVSAGALNAFALSLFPKWKQTEMIEFLQQFWLTVHSDNIYQDWKGGLIQGLLFEKGLWSTKPLYGILKKMAKQGIKREVLVRTLDLSTGIFQVSNQTQGSNFIKKVRASASVPILFEPVEIEGDLYVDGGSIVNIETNQGIQFCKEKFPGEEIVMDMIFTHPGTLQKVDDGWSVIQVFNRVNEISSVIETVEYYKVTRRSYPEVNFRYIVAPEKSFSDISFLNFDHERIKRYLKEGKSDMRSQIENPTVPFGEFSDKIRYANE